MGQDRESLPFKGLNVADAKIREALEKAFENTGNNFEPNEENTEVQDGGLADSAPETEDTSLNTAAEEKLAKDNTVSGDESKADTKKFDNESKNQPRAEKDKGEKKGLNKEVPKNAAPKAEPVATGAEDAPAFWKAEDKQAWVKVPPEVRQILKKYEDGRNYALSRYKQAANDKIGQWADASFDAVFPQERLRRLQMEGQTPAQATQGLWAWNDFLEESPPDAVLEIMERYGLTPEILYQHKLGNPQKSESQTFQDPRVDQLIEQNQNLVRQQETNQIKAQLDAFGGEAKDGKKLRPYWNDVKPYIQNILPLVYSENPMYSDYEALHEAYERAVYANPQVRTKLVNTNSQVKFSGEKTQRAKEAASASLTGSSSRIAEPPKTAKTAKDAISMAWAEVQSR